MQNISITELYQFISQTRRSGSSGFESDVEFNTNLALVDKEVYRTLVPFYSKDDRIQKLLSQFVTRQTLPIVNGAMTVPENYTKYIDTVFGDGGKIVYPRNLNERAVIKSSPIDNPSVSSSEYFCFFDGNKVLYLPESLSTGTLVYLRVSVPGEIKYNYTEASDADYIDVEQVKPIEWSNELFGLFSALMLEKYGYQNRESIAVEYSQLGIQREIANTTR